MRSVEDIRGDYQVVVTLDGSTQELEAATINLVNDVPDLLDILEKKDVEIKRLKADLAQSHSAVEKLSRGICNP